MNALPKPYYQDDWVTIYHGDCMDFLPLLPKVSLVLTDPPYGIKGGVGGQNTWRGKGKYEITSNWEDTPAYIKNRVVPAIRVCKKKYKRMILTPGNHCSYLYPKPRVIGCFFNPASAGWTAWGPNSFSPIFYYGDDPRSGIKGSCATGRLVNEPSEKNGHPCPKPTRAWKWLLNKGSLLGETILDPFSGSGTTGRVAKDSGRKSILIEIEEKYCEIAAKRMAQEALL